MDKARLAAVGFSVAGVAVSIYLTLLHYTGIVPACPVSGAINCEAVLSSSYAVVAGTSVPTSAAGIVWFGVSALLWAWRFSPVQLAWSAAGLLTVLYLVYVEIVQLGVICLWCTAAHLLVIAIAMIAISLSLQGRGSARGA
ncbi:MAG TPA: vitamin K epoxide reductase family protein [Candidatus Dormibacteraeota bacterium]|nr:vitamin K epoxide reductase family protein [Candidatus Dormibacteraeota bacterium]